VRVKKKSSDLNQDTETIIEGSICGINITETTIIAGINKKKTYRSIVHNNFI